jgi:hypothetical protein
MLIGNRDRFALEISPVAPSWERRYAPEAAAWAGLSVWAGGANICRHVRAGEEEIRDAFYVPLAPIADWIVRHHGALSLEERAAAYSIGRRLHEAVRAWGSAPAPYGLEEDQWLDAREAFWERHFLAAGAEGAHVPNIAFLREEDAVRVTWEPPRFVSPPEIDMLHARGDTTLPWSELSRILFDLAGHVVQAFVDASVPAPYPWMQSGRDTWGRVDAESAIELYCGRSLRELTAIVGLSDAQLEPVLRAARTGDPGASPVCQVVRDLPPKPSAGIGVEIQRAVDQARVSDPSRRSAWFGGRARASDAARAGGSPEERGQLAARGVRDELGLDGQPVESVPALLGRYGVELHSSTASFAQERMVIAGLADGTVAATILRTARTETRWGQRFEQARALGHALLDTMHEGAMGAASTRWAQASRRRCSGAFAAELLLPASALGEASNGVLDGATEGERFGELMDRYGVGARTAANQLYNQSWLSDAALRDELIEVHGHREE